MLLFVGRLAQEKGVSTLLQAWEGLPDIPLKVAGDGPLMPMVNEAAARATGAGVEALGWRSREDILDLLSEASFLVVPSLWYEGFPLTIIEAFACGVPVIGSRLGGVGEVIKQEQSGLLFDPGSATALADLGQASVGRHGTALTIGGWSENPVRSVLHCRAELQDADGDL